MGFLAGSLVLIAAYTLMQPGAAKNATGASGVAVGLLRRVLSAEVAGVPQKAAAGSGGAGGGAGGTGLGYALGGIVGGVAGQFAPPATQGLSPSWNPAAGEAPGVRRPGQ